jgi:hypothetical protein
MFQFTINCVDKHVQDNKIPINSIKNLNEEDKAASRIFGALRGYLTRKILNINLDEQEKWVFT